MWVQGCWVGDWFSLTSWGKNVWVLSLKFYNTLYVGYYYHPHLKEPHLKAVKSCGSCSWGSRTDVPNHIAHRYLHLRMKPRASNSALERRPIGEVTCISKLWRVMGLPVGMGMATSGTGTFLGKGTEMAASRWGTKGAHIERRGEGRPGFAMWRSPPSILPCWGVIRGL